MNRFISVTLFILALIFFSCETSPPSSVENENLNGEVFVTANIDSAEIFVDGENTGKLTPALLSLSAGSHEISVQKTNYLVDTRIVNVIANTQIEIEFFLQSTAAQKIVLIEDFANVSCIPCVTSNKILHRLVYDKYGTEKVVTVQYHVNFPAPNDIFYTANPTASNIRREFYDVVSAPSVFVDGLLNPVATDSNDIITDVESRLQTSASAEISISASIEAANLFTNVSVRVFDVDQNSIGDYKLFIALTETNIEFENPPGSNGETKFYDVMREMIPSAEGIQLSGDSINNEVNFNYSVQLNSEWNSKNLHIIAFIQDINTKEIIQAESNH